MGTMKKLELKETALITGASSGIGLELAREFARQQHSVIVVAPVAEEIRAVARDIQEHFGVVAIAIAADLTEPESATEIAATLADSAHSVGVLVNNAGLGQRGRFWEIPIEKDLEMVRLNVEAALRLTKLFLPPMVSRGHGRILNTVSVAGFEPGPLLAVYHATKAFMLSWSEALATELEESGVTVTALCPGPVDTDFFPKADMVDTKAFQKSSVMAPQEVAVAAYEAAMKGERVIIPGGMNKAQIFARRFTSEEGQAKKNEKYYEYVKPEERKRERGDIERKAAASAAETAQQLERRRELEAQPVPPVVPPPTF